MIEERGAAASARPGVPLMAPLERRRIGFALVAFGGSGLVILAVLGWLVLGPLGSLGAAATSVDDQRTRIVALLPAAEAALDSAATAATNAGTSLESSGQAARDGSDLLVQLATSMDGMSSAAQLSILGTQPFGALSQQLSAVAARSRGLATDLTAAADAIAANVTDSAAAAGRLHDLSAQIARLADELAGAGPATSAGGPSSGWPRPPSPRSGSAAASAATPWPEVSGDSGRPRRRSRPEAAIPGLAATRRFPA
jgi:hypothetical protein